MNLPLSFSPIATTSSREETEALFQDQLVTSRISKADNDNTFGVEMNGVSIGSSVLSCIRHRSEYEIDCGDIDNEGSIIFGFGGGRPSSTSFNGQNFDLNQHASIITRHSNVKHKRTSESYEFILNCSSEAVESRLQLILDRHLSRQLVFEQSMPMANPVGVHARSTVSYVMSSFDSNPDLLENPLVVANFEELLLGIVVSLPSNYSDELSNPHKLSAAPGVVTRAEAFIEANANLPITMSAVFAHVDCSRNTLFKNFHKFRGYTPWEFLTTTRLKLVHQRLLNATESDSVTSIAHSLGFSHLGRFSQIYRKRYGEKPSETMKRASI
jgi:AraC-like DNA-binding protein